MSLCMYFHSSLMQHQSVSALARTNTNLKHTHTYTRISINCPLSFFVSLFLKHTHTLLCLLPVINFFPLSHPQTLPLSLSLTHTFSIKHGQRQPDKCTRECEWLRFVCHPVQYRLGFLVFFVFSIFSSPARQLVLGADGARDTNLNAFSTASRRSPQPAAPSRRSRAAPAFFFNPPFSSSCSFLPPFHHQARLSWLPFVNLPAIVVSTVHRSRTVHCANTGAMFPKSLLTTETGGDGEMGTGGSVAGGWREMVRCGGHGGQWRWQSFAPHWHRQRTASFHKKGLTEWNKTRS